jgi:hypothetical protein
LYIPVTFGERHRLKTRLRRCVLLVGHSDPLVGIVFITISLLFAVAATVHVRAAPTVPVFLPPIPIGSSVYITDFQGNVFDLNNRSPVPLTAVSTLNRKLNEPAQEVGTVATSSVPILQFEYQWVLRNASSGNLFNIMNLASNPFLSFTTAATGANPALTQLCGQQVETAWNITANPNGTGYKYVNHSSPFVHYRCKQHNRIGVQEGRHELALYQFHYSRAYHSRESFLV